MTRNASRSRRSQNLWAGIVARRSSSVYAGETPIHPATGAGAKPSSCLSKEDRNAARACPARSTSPTPPCQLAGHFGNVLGGVSVRAVNGRHVAKTRLRHIGYVDSDQVHRDRANQRGKLAANDHAAHDWSALEACRRHSPPRSLRSGRAAKQPSDGYSLRLARARRSAGRSAARAAPAPGAAAI